MSFIKKSVGICIVLSAVRVPIIKGKLNNEGTDFVVGFMQNLRFDKTPYHNVYLVITTSCSTPVKVTVQSPRYGNLDETFYVSNGVVKRLEIDPSYRVNVTGISTKGITIAADNNVIVYGEDVEKYSVDNYLGLPINGLGTEYYAVTYYPTSGDAQILIIGIYDSTEVSITLPSNPNAMNVALDNILYKPGSTIFVTLDRCSTFLLQGKGELSGTHIVSTKVISVFTGDAKTEIGLESPKDHLIEQLIPVNKWGQKFLTVPTPNRTVGDFFKAINSEDNTFISYICNNSNEIISFYVRLQKAGNVSETLVPSKFYCYVVADKPILLVQLVRSQLSVDEESDPSMILIPAIEQYSANYTILVHNSSLGIPYNDNYFMFIIQENEINGFLIDGVFILNETYLTAIPGTGYVGGYVILDNGVHNICHVSSSVTYAGFLYGNAKWESYGFPVGMRLETINEVCIKPSPVVTMSTESKLDLYTSLCTPYPVTIYSTVLATVEISNSTMNETVFEEIIEDMKIDKRKTKSALRKLISSSDSRVSSRIAGFTATAIFGVIILILLANDFHSLFNAVRKKNVQII